MRPKKPKQKNYNDYYLLHDNEMVEVDFDLPEPREKRSKCLCYTITIFLLLSVTFFLLAFVVLPIIFMNFKSVQTGLIFTRFGLHDDKQFFKEQRLPGYKNRYVTLKSARNGTEETLGLWQILPEALAYKDTFEESVNFDEALLNKNYNVLIYFHGTGEDRADSRVKYDRFTPYFHVISFDYRGYADSTKGELTEESIVEDSIELFRWVQNKTLSDIYIWGHSLGAAIAAETVYKLENVDGIKIRGLVLESAFTNLADELYVHPITKIISWVPWFKATVVNPLKSNGILFETDKHVANITCPIMILHAEDDYEIPVAFGRKLYEIATKRNKTSLYFEIPSSEESGHNFIYQDPYISIYIMRFLQLTGLY